MQEDDEPIELDFSELADIVDAVEHADAASIKKALPIAYVLSQAGIDVTETGSRLTFFCPWHADVETPAGSVFGESLDRWSCWAGCGQGDVLDLIQKLAELNNDSLTFVEACVQARGLIAAMLEDGWSGPTAGKPRKEVDPDVVSFLVSKAQSNDDHSLIDALLSEKHRKDGPDSNRFSTDWLVEQFGVGVSTVRTKSGEWREEVIIPYYGHGKQLLTYKHRALADKAKAPAGAFPRDVYYNMWRTDMLNATILLCEGESDTWNAQYEVGDTYRVLGLPTGVSTRPSNLDMFKGKNVLIAFDGDDAGRAGAAAWAGYLQAEKCNVRIVPIPEGKDISACAASLRSMCASARPIVARPTGLTTTDIGYRRSGESEAPISNFTLRPVRELSGPDFTAYEVVLLPGGEEVIISSVDMRNKTAMLTWALKHKRAWYGSDRDVQILLGMLQADSVYLPIGHMASTAGLHDKHFVWPGGVIGPDPWSYVPPPNNSQLEDAMFIRPGQWEPAYVHVLRDMHKHAVMDPMLAWMAVAPLRTLLKEFPILAISGPHGSGKTRTLETLLRAFTGTYIANTLTGTTPHAVMAGFSATNAFPVVFEEYRNGAREEARIRFEQLARDAYTCQKSQMGGMKGNWAELSNIVPTAPIVVSGEDMLTEGSHIERMIPIQMFRDGQNSKAFETANRWKNNGFPYAYLTWLHRSLMDDDFAELRVAPAGPGDLGPRQRINVGILYLGWTLLRKFLEDGGESISDPDFSMVFSELREANSHTPIEDAIYHCLSETAAQGFCFQHEGNIMIRLNAFVGYINEQNRRGDLGLVLPGRGPAVKKYLQMKYGASEHKKSQNGLLQTYLVLDMSKLP